MIIAASFSMLYFASASAAILTATFCMSSDTGVSVVGGRWTRVGEGNAMYAGCGVWGAGWCVIHVVRVG